jgi:hypothetical protein
MLAGRGLLPWQFRDVAAADALDHKLWATAALRMRTGEVNEMPT